MKQLEFDFSNKEQENKEKPYRNAAGQLLPWEEPEYLEKLGQEDKKSGS